MATAATALNREALADWYRRNRQRSRQLFDIVRPEAYYSRPIALRQPDRVLRGAPAGVQLNTLVKKALGRPGVDERLERLFARGIDPEDEASASRSQRDRVAVARRGPTLRRRLRCPHSGSACECAARAARTSAVARGTGGVRHPRARGDASGNDALHVASAALRAEAGASRNDAQTTRGRRRQPTRVDGPGRPRDAWRTPGRDSLRLGQRVPRPRRRRARLRDRRPQRDERAVHGVRRRGRLPASGVVDARGLRLGSSGRHRASAVLDAPQRHVEVAWHVRRDRPAARVAGLRQPGGGSGVRPLEGRTPADRSRVPPRGVRRTVGGRAAVSLGRCGAGCVARALRLRVLESCRCRTTSRGPKRVGRRTI